MARPPTISPQSNVVAQEAFATLRRSHVHIVHPHHAFGPVCGGSDLLYVLADAIDFEGRGSPWRLHRKNLSTFTIGRHRMGGRSPSCWRNAASRMPSTRSTSAKATSS